MPWLENDTVNGNGVKICVSSAMGLVHMHTFWQVTVGPAQVFLMTLTMDLFYSTVPVIHFICHTYGLLTRDVWKCVVCENGLFQATSVLGMRQREGKPEFLTSRFMYSVYHPSIPWLLLHPHLILHFHRHHTHSLYLSMLTLPLCFFQSKWFLHIPWSYFSISLRLAEHCAHSSVLSCCSSWCNLWKWE